MRRATLRQKSAIGHGGVGPNVAAELAAAGANAFVAGSSVFKGGTQEAYKANIDAIRLKAAAARGEALSMCSYN